MPFINESFLLKTSTARDLYHAHAAQQPIFDYHCHLPPKDIANNHRFRDLTEIWLEGDHYKWRAMRANGVPEKYCTGAADPYEKFFAWARTVPYTLRNPLYHWTHLELSRYFGIDELLDESTAPSIWKRANEQLQSGGLTTHGILEKFHVTALCTTDDPTDSLEDHERIRASGLSTQVYPAFRPDAALRTSDPSAFNAWVDKLAAIADTEIADLSHFLEALETRHDFFHERGCRLSDHGLVTCPAEYATRNEAESTFEKVRAGKSLTQLEEAAFSGFLMLCFGELDARRGWTKQLHLGAARNNNTRMLATLGKDTGFDCIGDWPQIPALVGYLDRLERANHLPKIIVYNLNPADNYPFASLINSFQGDGIPGRIQFGTAWWFLDQKEGMELQINALSNCSLLSRFVGMVTDSRSFMSYPRHEYFRRTLCNMIGNEVESGELPQDEPLLGKMIENICYNNAVAHFQLPGSPAAAAPQLLGSDIARTR
jgi:glucuronate isomerase